MGFFSSILGGKEKCARLSLSVSARMDFSELSSWIESSKASLKCGVEETAEDVGKRALHATGDIEEKIKLLDGEEIKNNIPEHAKDIVNGAKRNYSKTLRRAIAIVSPESAPLKISEEINSALSEMKAADLKYGERVKFGYPSEVQKIRKDLNRLVGASDELNTMLDERKRMLVKIGEIEKVSKKIEGTSSEISKLESERDNVRKELKALGSAKKSKEDGIDAAEHSDKARKLASLEAGLTRLNERKSELEVFVANILNPLKRAFKKFARAVSEGKAEGINVERYAEDPSGTYLWGEHTLPDLLAHMQKAIQTGIIDFDANEAEKTIRKIRAISFSYLEKARLEHNELESKIRTSELALSKLAEDNEVARLSGDLEGLKSKIAGEERKESKITTEIDSLKERKTSELHSVSSLISELTGSPVEIY